jgi:hypothetical protein
MWPTLGRHTEDLLALPDGVEQVTGFLKLVFIGQLMYTFGISFSKFSILAFYWRLFSVTARIPIYVMSFVAFGWCTGIVSSNPLPQKNSTESFLQATTVIFACDPVAASWDITITESTCLSLKSIYLGGSLVNATTDVILILMPLPYVWRLQAPISQRVLLGGLFMLGIFIAIVSVVRLIIFLHIPIDQAGDATFHFREIIVWSCVEVNVGLACACLPSLKPALTLLGLNRVFAFADSRNPDPNSEGPSNNYNSWSTGTDPDRSRKPRKKGATGGLFSTLAGISRMEDEDEDGYHLTNSGAHGKVTADAQHDRNFSVDTSDHVSQDSRHTAPGGISVQKHWSVQRERQEI